MSRTVGEVTEATSRVVGKDWIQAPVWCRWIAIDGSGQVWGYESRPSWSEQGQCWFDYFGDRMRHLCITDAGGKEMIWTIRPGSSFCPSRLIQLRRPS